MTSLGMPIRRMAASTALLDMGRRGERGLGKSYSKCPVTGCSSRRTATAWVLKGTIYGCARIPQRHFRIDAQGEEFFLAGVAILEAPVPAAIGLYEQEESPDVRELVVRNARSGLSDRRVGEWHFGGISKSRFEYAPKSTPGKGWQFLAIAGRQWTSLELKNLCLPMFEQKKPAKMRAHLLSLGGGGGN